VFAVTTLVAEFHPPSAPLPAHQLVFNAIGDADLSNPDLLSAARLLAGSSAPVINPPAKVMATARAANAARLGALPGVVTPKMVTLPRAAFGGHDIGTLLGGLDLAFPLLLRSPGFHTGQHFLRVDRSDDLAAAAQSLPGDALMVIEFLDTRGDDGLARKYRVMMIGGRLYPLHLAISTDWKVHYATAAMSDQPAFQAEEARFLEQMPDVLGERAMAALGAIEAALGLDYAGVDFALSAEGELVVFEANAVMNIIPPDASPQWDYRRAAVDRALGAARALLVERSASSVAADA
jgi:glutathione synthase/RimK-type ligase-like ATP-grasp enzyme